MSKAPFTRQYVIMRPIRGSSGGFTRFEMKQGRISAVIRLTQISASSLRVLLLSGDPATGAVIDLGLMRMSPRRQASLYREDLPAECAACHTVAVCTDWPDAQLLLYGYLTQRPACTLWQLQETVQRYLRVPLKDGALPEPIQPEEPSRPLPLCMLLPPILNIDARGAKGVQ